MRVRKKPVIVNAEQFVIDPITKRPKQTPEGVHLWPDEHGAQPRDTTWGYIDTLEGRHHVKANDWIITGIKGEKYPCKPDIFEMTYEIVEEVLDNKDDIIEDKEKRKEVKMIIMTDQQEQQMRDLRVKEQLGTITPEEKTLLTALLELDEDSEDVVVANQAVAIAQTAVDTAQQAVDQSALDALNTAKANLAAAQTAQQTAVAQQTTTETAVEAAEAAVTAAQGGGTSTTPTDGGTTTA